MQLTKNFTLAELTKSATAAKRGISNKPTKEHEASLKRLAESILQPLRDYLGYPITITSGYRSHELNTAVGGSKKSQHSKGEAADIVVKDYDAFQLALDIDKLKLPFDQLIYESVGGARWVHVSIAPVGQKPRGQKLTTFDGKSYHVGLRK